MFSDVFTEFWPRLAALQLFFWRNRLRVADASIAATAIVLLSNYYHVSSSGGISFSMPLGAQLATGFGGWIVCISSPRLRPKIGQMLNEFVGLVSYFVVFAAVISTVVIFLIQIFGVQEAVRDFWFIDVGVNEQGAKMLTALLFAATAFLLMFANTIRQNPDWKKDISTSDGVLAMLLLIGTGWLNLYSGFFQNAGLFVG